MVPINFIEMIKPKPEVERIKRRNIIVKQKKMLYRDAEGHNL